jgi:hypothetical protein
VTGVQTCALPISRGIPLARVCGKCVDKVLRKYRPEVLTNSNYYADEPIESEDY